MKRWPSWKMWRESMYLYTYSPWMKVYEDVGFSACSRPCARRGRLWLALQGITNGDQLMTFSAHLHERQPPGHSSSFVPNGLSWPCCLKFMGILSRQFLCESSLHSSRETPFIVSLPTTGKFLKKRDKEGSNKGHDFVSRWILSCGEEKIALEWEGRIVNVYLTSCP